MTYPPNTQDNSGGTTQQTQETHVSGSIMEIEYKPPEDEKKEPPKKSRKGLKIFAMFAVLVFLMLVVIGAMALYVLWPDNQVLELEGIVIDVETDTMNHRHWKVSGQVRNIGDMALDMSKIQISISGEVVQDTIKDDLTRISTDPQIVSGTKKNLEPDFTAGFTNWAPVQESTATTRPIIFVKVYYDGDMMHSEDVDVGGKW